MTIDQHSSLLDIPEARPFLLDGGDTGVLLLHGFTSTPQSVRDVGHALHGLSGATVSVPLIAGHGETPEALAETGQQDWVASAEEALEDLRSRCGAVIVAGLSLGATLALNLAARRTDLVDGLVCINASTGLYRPEVVLPLYGPDGPDFLPGIGSDIRKEGVREICYDRIPRATLRERFLLTQCTGALLPLIRCPCLVIQSREDHVVSPRNAMRIVSEVGASDVRLVWLDRSWHVATLDHDRERIVELAGGFVAQVEGAQGFSRSPA
jgi:carboxylesterase